MEKSIEAVPTTILVRSESEVETRLRHTVNADLSMILANFACHQPGTFATFKACWDRLDFVLVHVARPEDIPYDWYMCCLFDELLDIMMKSRNPMEQVGGVFLLFFLYKSQPQDCPIYLSVSKWDFLKSLCASPSTPEEARRIMGRLKRGGALCLTAMTRKEVTEAFALYKTRLEEETSPSEVVKNVYAELEGIQQAIISDRALLDPEQIRELTSLETEYTALKHRIIPLVPEQLHLSKGDLSKDLSQSQRDWSATLFDLIADSNTSSKGKRKLSRRATVGAEMMRPSTAPPTSLGSEYSMMTPPVRPISPPDYIINAEHMPSLL